jgi:tRNA-Thr(GGU) m(6)t(6)A37 methyltransferase TsaA
MFPLCPIGIVRSPNICDNNCYPFYYQAQIEIMDEFLPGLLRLEENSHIWVICLYQKQENASLHIKPQRHTKNIADFGVFALRSPNHPNPLSLTLTRLNKIENNILYVESLDAYDQTPVLDIKPYSDDDIIFSPRMPYIQKEDTRLRQYLMIKRAVNHHQEECSGLALAVKMSLWLEDMGIKIQEPSLSIIARGSLCLADSLQGLGRARLANPSRFSYQEAAQDGCCFLYQGQKINIAVKDSIPQDYQTILEMSNADLFTLKVSE